LKHDSHDPEHNSPVLPVAAYKNQLSHLISRHIEIGQEAGWAPEPVWTRWWREKFPAPAGTRTSDHPARSPALHHWAIPPPPPKYGWISLNEELRTSWMSPKSLSVYSANILNSSLVTSDASRGL
jgi:hypothetical protein